MKVLSIIIVINVSMLVGFVSGSQKNTTEAFKWTSENEYDTAQLVTKRILYAFRLWIFRLSVFATICAFINLIIGLPCLGLIVGLMYKSNAKIQRKTLQYSNTQELEKKFKEKIKENEMLRYKRSSKSVVRNTTRNKRNPKLKKEKKK